MLTQLRLYLLAGIVIAFLALAGVALWYRGEAISAEGERDKARADLATAVAANKEAVAALDAVQEQARRDGQLAADLAARNRALADDLTEKDAALAEMEKINADLRSFLDRPVPPDLGRLYDH